MGTIEAGAQRGHSCVQAGGSFEARATGLCCAPVCGRRAWGVSRVIVAERWAVLKPTRGAKSSAKLALSATITPFRLSHPEQRPQHVQTRA